jgi:ubiquinone/menaquinone biosynthesis C-methylase UbiE
MTHQPVNNDELGEVARRHLQSVQACYDDRPAPTRAARAYQQTLAHYYNLIIPREASVLEIGCGCGELLSRLHARDVTGVDLSPAQVARAREKVPHGTFLCQAGESLELGGREFDYIIISDALNLAADVQRLLERLHRSSRAETRLILNFHSALWRPILSLASSLRLRGPTPQNSWIASDDVRAFLALSGWEIVKASPRILCPLDLAGIGGFLNRWLAPLFPWLCLSVFSIARRSPIAGAPPVGVSVIVPARNEAGNIENAVLRTPEMGAGTEMVFVEGHSGDATWAEIQRVEAKYRGRRKIRILRQTGRGKANAVREGFEAAEGGILMILDADLTMPPEELPKFYHAVANGTCDFANGCRLVYPMEDQAMPFLNLCANKAFSILFSWLLGQAVKDTLCGTKVLTAANYRKIAANRGYFGDFDPFGDFDLLFGADKLNLKILDVPIRYQNRTYGETNIRRWRHGWLLLRMVGFAARKLKFV